MCLKKDVMTDYLSRSCNQNTAATNLDFDDPTSHVGEVAIRDACLEQTYSELTSSDDGPRIVSEYVKSGWHRHKRLCHSLANTYWSFRDISEYDGLLRE